MAKFVTVILFSFADWLSIRLEKKKMILVESNDEIKEMMRLDAIGAQ